MRNAVLALLVLGACISAGAQTMLTAEAFFGTVSDRYAAIDDYEAAVTITSGKQIMNGSMSFKAPSLLRIDFSQPAEQVIVYTGSRLIVYLPQYRAILSQESGDVKATGAGLASRDGLRMMKRSYTIAWESGPDPVPLETGSKENVHRLALARRTVSDGLKTIRLSVSPDTMLIRRMEGWTIANERIVFDFRNIRINPGIPANRFLYDPPASANVYGNFLFKSDD